MDAIGCSFIFCALIIGLCALRELARAKSRRHARAARAAIEAMPFDELAAKHPEIAARIDRELAAIFRRATGDRA